MRFIQSDQKVSVHLLSVLLSLGAQRLLITLYVVPHDSAPSVKKTSGNWRLRAIYSESRHMSIPVPSPLRKTPSVYIIGAYSTWTPKPARSSGDTSVYCLLFVVSYGVSYRANQAN